MKYRLLIRILLCSVFCLGTAAALAEDQNTDCLTMDTVCGEPSAEYYMPCTVNFLYASSCSSSSADNTECISQYNDVTENKCKDQNCNDLVKEAKRLAKNCREPDKTAISPSV